MVDDEAEVLAGAEDRVVTASRHRRSSDPAVVCLRSSPVQLTDDTPPASADDHVTAAGSAQDYPGFVERAFFVLDQTMPPRSWCLRLITWPYPLLTRFTISPTHVRFKLKF